ncbi:MATE family efflux transporter [Ruminococcus albus]|uniref:Putative efflux protein, MATE family n=1 Tax=Ruminococcus albus TaxID=1264 RepID=A0A1H7J0Q3_RUMAL|nr:MATE family efflux transporter [Ruminococcus albus]SEK68216.1 putative efflux protein, MATE family [Ruminococcus albus]
MNSTSDLTQGRPFKLIMRFFFPLLLTNSLQQLYSFADTAIVGKGLGDDSLAAVGNMSSLCFLIIGFSMGLSNGFSILIAQSFGEKNMDKLRRTLAHSIELASVITVLLTLFSAFFLRPILILLRTDPSIIEESLQYGYILFGGLAATIMYNMCAGILRALGDSKTPLKAIIVSSVMNITLNSVFIFIFRWGVRGAALATIVSQVFSGAVCFDKLRKTDFLALSKSDFSHDTKMYSVLLGNGIPMALMNSITAVGCMAVQYFVNGLGVAFTSAYSACSRYLNMFMQPAATAGAAMSSYTSQNYGAKRFDRIWDGLKVCLGIAGAAYLVFGSVMVFFPEWLASLILSGEKQISYAAEFLPVCGVMILSVDMLFVIRNGVQGMGFPFVPMLSGIAEMVLRIGAIVLLIDSMGFKATAAAEIFAWVGALLINSAAFIVIFAREKAKYSDKKNCIASYAHSAR